MAFCSQLVPGDKKSYQRCFNIKKNKVFILAADMCEVQTEWFGVDVAELRRVHLDLRETHFPPQLTSHLSFISAHISLLPALCSPHDMRKRVWTLRLMFTEHKPAVKHESAACQHLVFHL